jgi:hypothetical protein
LNFEKADNFPVAYYSGGDRKPKGSPFPEPAEVEPEPGEWGVTFMNTGLRANTVKWVSPSRMLAQLVVSGNGKLEASRCWG